MSNPTTTPATPPAWRRLAVGAELAPDGGVHFRLWAPACRAVHLLLASPRGERAIPMDAEAGGYFSLLVADAAAGMRYRFRLDGGDARPDPVSRFQPEGVHGPSEVVDPGTFRWSDDDWRGRSLEDAVIYELHVGAFTPEGTWSAASERLARLADLGVTVLEVMPVAEFPGRFGWGYDGVDLFAPTRLYGVPDDMRRFVDRAHALGLAVILDVVYNHLGPDGNYLKSFAPAYFSEKHSSEWGGTPNFDGESSEPVREFVLANAEYWIREFHLDGLRLDATQAIHDDSPSDRHILTGIGRAVRRAAAGRATIVVNENEPQHARLVRPSGRGGYALDGIWNDDFHHAAMVAVSGRDEAYYTDYRGTAQELLSAVKWGFIYQGQWYRWQHARRGSSALDLQPSVFVHFLQNHDQVANSGLGARGHCLTSEARWRAVTTLLLLGPQTPMLFMGQEFASSAPFHYFADHEPKLAALVQKGRTADLGQFRTLTTEAMKRRLAVPHEPDTFERCRLDWSEWEENAEWVALHRDLLRLRREEPALRRRDRGGFDGAVLSADCFLLRWLDDDGAGDRLLLVNLGRTLHLDPAPEPLLAPPDGMRWDVRWSSEDPAYGGAGVTLPDASELPREVPDKPYQRHPFENWRIPGECAVLLVPRLADAPADPRPTDEP